MLEAAQRKETTREHPRGENKWAHPYTQGLLTPIS